MRDTVDKQNSGVEGILTFSDGYGKKAQIPEGLGKIRCSRLYRFSIGGGLYAQKPD
jgi:hypothetical protein